MSTTRESPFPQSPFIASVIGRVGSSRRASRFIAAAIRAPRSPPCTRPSSLPMDHARTQGWLRSRRIIRPNWLSASSLEPSIRVSSSTSIPSRSQASSSSGVGGLCEVR